MRQTLIIRKKQHSKHEGGFVEVFLDGCSSERQPLKVSFYSNNRS